MASEREDLCHPITGGTLFKTNFGKQTGSYQFIPDRWAWTQGAALVVDWVAPFIPCNSCLYWEEPVSLR